MIVESALRLFKPMQDGLRLIGRNALTPKEGDNLRLPYHSALARLDRSQSHAKFALAFDRHFRARLIAFITLNPSADCDNCQSPTVKIIRPQ